MAHGRLNQRQEKFCLLIVKGETQSRAYALAGYSTKSSESVAVNASKLITNPKIIAFIAKMRNRVRDATIIDVQFLTDRLLDVAEKATLATQFGSATSAYGLIAKLHGLVVDKSEQTVMHRPAPLPTSIIELSEDDWVHQFANGPQKLRRLPQVNNPDIKK